MDYPKSVPGVGLVDGKFVDENPGAGQVGSLIPSKWGNDLTDEVLNVVREAGIDPDEATTTQLRDAVLAIAKRAAEIGFTPVQQGTGVGQGKNTVKIGWAKDGSGLRVTVDSSDLGLVAFASQLAAYASQKWVREYAVSKGGDTMTGDLSIKRSGNDAKGLLLKRQDGTGQFWLHGAKDYVALAVMKADGSWRENVFTTRESDFFTTFVGGVAVGSLSSVNDLNWGNAGARTAFDGNIWGTRWSTDGKGSPDWLGNWVLALVNGRADWNAVNGKANAGARVQWDSGIAEWGIMDIGINIPAHTVDIPAPWVMVGMRKEANNTRCYLRGVVLRNQ